jgi:hypothetical protein
MTEWIEAWFHPERAGTGLPDPGVMTVKQMPVVAGLVLAEVSTVMGAAACCLLRTVARRLKGGRRQEAMCWGAHAALEAPRQQHHAPSAHTPAARPCPCPCLPCLQVLLSNALGRKVYNLRQSINNVAAGILTLILLGELVLSGC